MVTQEQNKLWDYRIISKIGQGEYGMVYKVRHKSTDQVYALKKINISNMSEKQKIQAFREIKMLKRLDHPSIIKYYESFLSSQNLYIVMEYAENGDMATAIAKRQHLRDKYKECDLWNTFRLLADAVKHLHENSIIHRDIKLQNIFIKKDMSLKLGDLGLSKILQNKADMTSQRVGTPIYFAPELIQHQPYSFGIDIWALGCVYYFLLDLRHPFQGATLESLAEYVLQRGPAPLKSCIYSAQIVKFIYSLLDRNPLTRPNINQVIEMMNVAQVSEAKHRVSVHNSRILSSLLTQEQTKESWPESPTKQEPLTVTYRRMKIRSRDGNQTQRSQFRQSFVKEPDLSEVLQNVMGKTLKELEVLTDRRRSCDDIINNAEQQELQMRRSSMIHSSMIKSNGFQRADFKVHVVTTRYSAIQNKKGVLGPRFKYSANNF